MKQIDIAFRSEINGEEKFIMTASELNKFLNPKKFHELKLYLIMMQNVIEVEKPKEEKGGVSLVKRQADEIKVTNNGR